MRIITHQYTDLTPIAQMQISPQNRAPFACPEPIKDLECKDNLIFQTVYF